MAIDLGIKNIRMLPRPVWGLIILFMAGAVGFAWSQRALVASKAYGALAEAPLAGSDERAIVAYADVRWSFVPNGPFGPEVAAEVAIPERRQIIHFTIHRNIDDQFPATHIIEVISEPARFPGRTIAAVPAVFVKAAPDKAGNRLIGTAVTVASDRFWFALSAERFDAMANLRALRDDKVFELVLIYGTGRQASLLFEKGASGEQAFEQAMPLWLEADQ